MNDTKIDSQPASSHTLSEHASKEIVSQYGVRLAREGPQEASRDQGVIGGDGGDGEGAV